MKSNPGRILVSHVGSLPRPKKLLDMMRNRLTGEGEAVDDATYERTVAESVAEIVRLQAENGIDIVSDGETSKAGFFVYAKQRLTGLEGRPGVTFDLYPQECEAFPEYYEAYFKRAMLGGNVAPVVPLFATGPVKYVGEADLKRDISNLKKATETVRCEGVFMPATAPSGVGANDYYKDEEEFFFALGDALRTEYLAIVEAGFDVQVDDPFLSEIFGDRNLDGKQKLRKADIFVESVNHALRGIPQEQVRFHTCYGINEGPRIFEPQLREVLPHILRINAGLYSFEAANPRHQHDYHAFEDTKMPDGKKIMPGMVTHAGNIVEHPELIAEWLVRFARLVGRDNVVAGADCGFSSQACYHPEVHPTVMWAKFRSLAEGAKLASRQLWGKAA